MAFDFSQSSASGSEYGPNTAVPGMYAHTLDTDEGFAATAPQGQPSPGWVRLLAVLDERRMDLATRRFLECARGPLGVGSLHRNVVAAAFMTLRLQQLADDTEDYETWRAAAAIFAETGAHPTVPERFWAPASPPEDDEHLAQPVIDAYKSL